MLWRMKWRSLWNRSLQQDLDDELRSHIELKAEELESQGLSPEDAWREARRRFGNLTAANEKTREMHVFTLLETLFNDTRYALRRLGREPAFTLTAILTLALVIGANGAIFSLVEAVLLRPLPYPNPDRLVMLFGTDGQSSRDAIAAPDLEDLAKARSLTVVAAEQRNSVSLTGVEEPGRLVGHFVSSPFFQMLGVQPAVGRLFGPDEDRPGSERVCVLSHAVWQDRFGANPALVGQLLILNSEAFTVIGILPKSFRPKFSNGEVWIPVQFYPNYSRDRARPSVQAMARLADGVSLQQAQAEIDIIAKQLAEQYPGTNRNKGVVVRSLQEVSVGYARETLLVLAGAAGCVLLIGCANIASLLLTRATSRKHEIAIRASLGASRSRLTRQLFTESLVLALAGGALGVAVAYGGMQLLISYCGDLAGVGELAINGTVVLYLAAVSVFTGLLFGMAPAAFARHHAAAFLRQRGAGSGKGGPLNLLVTAQVALAMALLIGAGLMLRTVRNIANINPGFNGERVLTMEYRIPPTKYPSGAQQTQFHHAVAARVSAVPGVESAALIGALPFSGNKNLSPISIPGRPERAAGLPIVVQTNPATPGYFHTVGIPLLAGRDFVPGDGPGAQLVAIVSKSFNERFWPGESATGRQVNLLRGQTPVTVTVVGVVGNTRQDSLTDADTPQLYQPYAQDPFLFATLTVKTTGDPLAVTRSVQRAIWSIDKYQPMWKIRTLQSLVDRSFSYRRYVVYLLGSFSLLALGLAAVGLFGLLSYAVTQRTAEFGIRAAVGASPADILQLVLRKGLVLTVAGLAMGVMAAMVLTQYLSSQVYGVSTTDPLVYASVAAILLMVALVAVLLPARHAMRVDPVVALRQE
jgi:putative ABC transport system permease protein